MMHARKPAPWRGWVPAPTSETQSQAMNKPLTDWPDYPAAHSMDAQWFAIDDAGEVACLYTSEDGPMPIGAAPESMFYDLVSAMATDEHGVPLLPTSGDFFPDGPSMQVLDERLAQLTPEERAALEGWVPGSQPTGQNQQLLKALGTYWPGPAVMLLTNAEDAATIKGAGFVVRLDAAVPLYFGEDLPVADLLRLHSLGRVLAVRWIPIKKDVRDSMGMPEVLGIYWFSAKGYFEERESADGSTEYLPPRYVRQVEPTQPRIGMPDLTWPDGSKLVHRLQGVRFADATDFQLADLMACKGWGWTRPDNKDGT